MMTGSAHIVQPPLHAPEVVPEVHKGQDDLDAVLACLGQDQVEARQASWVEHAWLRASQRCRMRSSVCKEGPTCF